MNSTQDIGFVGLGDMGGRIASRIVAAGFRLAVADRRAAPVADLVATGARAAADLPALAKQSDVVCICVVDDEQVLGVTRELAAALKPGATVVIHSSVLPDTVSRVAELLAPARAAVLDAPVSGSRPAAEDGT